MTTANGPICSSASLYGQACSTTSLCYFQCDGDTIRMSTLRTPASSTATGNMGEWCADANYFYVCVSANVWKRAALSSF
jgi:hypothetical protein